MTTRRRRPRLRAVAHKLFWMTLVVALFVAAAYYLASLRDTSGDDLHTTPSPAAARAGDIIGIDSAQTFTVPQAEALAKENYGAATLPVTTSVTKIVFHYRSQLPTGGWITEYGRAYLPAAPASNLPVFGFAPGTTGIGDECAASLEDVKKANWANYDSHMVMYASQGMAAVTTDYEGMRDPSRIHHYMVGELEGRALLDAVRALQNLPQTKNRLDMANLFLGGYSQGGQAAFWADKLADSYAPALKVRGVVGWGPVMDVKQTLADVTRGANINWFGPYVLYSYHDYYGTTYPLNDILLPVTAANLGHDVPANCINTDIQHWGHNPAGVYTPEFLAVLSSGAWQGSAYAELGRQLDQNAVGADLTTSAKRINTGSADNVVLPSQQTAAFQLLCTSSAGSVQQAVYPGATHYDDMVRSLADTINWMHQLERGETPVSTCPAG